MTTLKTWTGVCLTFVFITTLMSGTIAAQDTKVFEGMLMGIDQNNRVLTLKADDKEMQFIYNDQTELISPEKDGQPVVVTQGTRLKVHYTESEKRYIAIKIEIAAPAAAARSESNQK